MATRQVEIDRNCNETNNKKGTTTNENNRIWSNFEMKKIECGALSVGCGPKSSCISSAVVAACVCVVYYTYATHNITICIWPMLESINLRS